MNISALITVLFYLASAGYIGFHFYRQSKAQKPLILVMASVAIIAHVLFMNDIIFGFYGQNLSIANVASLVSLLIAAGLTLASLYYPNALLLPVVYVFSALMVATAWLVPSEYITHVELKPQLLIHISLALFAYGCLLISMLYAFQLAYINYHLKHKALGAVNTMPPLLTVELQLYRMLVVGTVLLSFSLLSGFVFLEDMFAQHKVHKTILSSIAWCVFAGLLFGHYKMGWRGKITVSGTVLGCFLLTLAYFGSRIVKEVILNQ